MHLSYQRRVMLEATGYNIPEAIKYSIHSEQYLQLGHSQAFMAATMLAGNPQVIGLPNSTAPWDHTDPNGIIAHLSPQYDNSTDELNEIMNGSPPSQLSPQTFETNEGCNNWLIGHGTPYGLVYGNGSHYMNTGGQSPDSGSKGQSLTSSSKVYSPHGSPQALDLSDSRLQTSCAALQLPPPPPLSSNCDLSQSIRDYPPISTSSFAHPELFAVPSASSSLTPYTQSPSISHFDSMMFTNSGSEVASTRTGYPQPYSTSSEVSAEHNMDPIPIIPLDQATGNPIQFYSDCTTNDLSPRPPYDPITPPCPTSSYSNNMSFSNIKAADNHAPVKAKRNRRQKPQVQVDPSDIKDVPASAQLWEFLLKVLKKPKYNYMVSWESRKDGLFRFHDPSAFAALWGRHRNRPNMTYDKVARALRYYYRREILEQVGGRLTYKFTPRLCKQFADKQHHHSSATTSTSTSTSSSHSSSSS